MCMSLKFIKHFHYLTLPIAMGVEQHKCSSAHFTDEETEAQKRLTLKGTQLLNGRAGALPSLLPAGS